MVELAFFFNRLHPAPCWPTLMLVPHSDCLCMTGKFRECKKLSSGKASTISGCEPAAHDKSPPQELSRTDLDKVYLFRSADYICPRQYCLASSTAIWPTPPDPACTRTLSPGLMLALLKAWKAVTETKGMAPASLFNDKVLGERTSNSSGTTVYSAQLPTQDMKEA